MYTEEHHDRDFHEDDGASPLPPVPATSKAERYEYWLDCWQDELVMLYHDLVDAATGRGLAVLDRCSFAAFCEFAYAASSKSVEGAF